MRKHSWKAACVALLAASAVLLGGCASSAEAKPEPQPTQAPLKAQATVAWPKDKLQANGQGEPTLTVYVANEGGNESVALERYVEGVLAGEMQNDWPLEALRAQAILARTFVLKFVQDKQSKYEGADISTDIEEAQAYDQAAVNDPIRKAVAQTEGVVLASGGQLPYAWFHAHSGGMTARAKEGLNWNKAEPEYTRVAQGNEPEEADAAHAEALEAAQAWEASFAADEFAAACKSIGAPVKLGATTALSVAERGESGRALTLDVGGQSVNASELRIALGSTKMRSTLLTGLRIKNGQIEMSGKGYGHGVGMSQWGAYAMAQNGQTAEEIIAHYFRDVSLATLW